MKWVGGNIRVTFFKMGGSFVKGKKLPQMSDNGIINPIIKAFILFLLIKNLTNKTPKVEATKLFKKI